jgi:hypothetical protein
LRNIAQQCEREAAPKHGGDLRDLARPTQSVEPRGERLLRGRLDRLQPACFVPLQQETPDLLDSGTPPVRSFTYHIL